MTTIVGSEEVRSQAQDLVKELGSLNSQFVYHDDTSHMQHVDFADRASEYAEYIDSALDLSQQGRFAQAFALLRTALDQWADDLVVLLGDRFVQLYDNATEEVLADAVDRWNRGELPSIVEEPTLVGKARSKLRVVRRGFVANDDESIVLHPMYFEAKNFDPFYGPPDEQPGFADWFEESRTADHAIEQRQRYNAHFKWGALVDSLVLNGIVADRHRLHLNVHHRFLSAFVHSHHEAHRILRSPPPAHRSGPPEPHAVEELVLLYAVQLSARYLQAFAKMTDRPPSVRLANRTQIEESVAAGLDRTAHLWFLADDPSAYDRGQELLARKGRAEEFTPSTNALADAMTIAVEEVRYYRNPLDRLRRLHQSSTEMVTGFTYVSPWA